METTAQEHRDAAQASRQRAAESWDRSDTDGFVTQWASDLTAREHDMKAALIEAGGKIAVEALFDLDGNVASTHSGYGQYGEYWVLNDDAAAKYGKRFFSPSKAQTPATAHANNAKKGFVLGTIRVDGYVKIIGGGGTGLSGAVGCYPAMLPIVERLKSGDFDIVTTDWYADESDDDQTTEGN